MPRTLQLDIRASITRAACRLFVVTSLAFHLAPTNAASTLADSIERIRPSIVGVGTYQPLRRPRSKLSGTGFVIGNGLLIATNHHVVNAELDIGHNEKLVAFIGHGREPKLRDVKIAAIDRRHDLALLRIEGSALPAMQLSDDSATREGDPIAFTGFPIGAVLGLYPVIHRGIVSAITPIVIPADNSRVLTGDHIHALRDPYLVFQLDATASPGNSGSPVYHELDGRVIGVINQVLVKGTKESVLTDPSAISYAIPMKFLRKLM